MSTAKGHPALADGHSGEPATETAALRAALEEVLRATDGTSGDIEERLRVIQRRLGAATKESVAGALQPRRD